jgi:signal transduction histidine kinase
MRKVAVMFVVAVFVPSLVLAWLAVRSLRDQQFLLERQQSLLYQGVTDSFAEQIQERVAQHQRDFGSQIEAMLARHSARDIAVSFDERLRTNWPPAKVGFVVTVGGDILSPTLNSRSEAKSFREDNELFLGNREIAEAYLNYVPSQVNVPQQAAPAESSWLPSRARSQTQAAAPPDTTASQAATAQNTLQMKAPATRNIQPQQKVEVARQFRDADQAAPQVQEELSKVAPAEAEFKELIGDATEGTLARFVNNKLNILFWYRPAAESRYIFGAQLDIDRLSEELRFLAQDLDRQLRSDLCLAILDDSARPIALSHAGFQATWKRPFVATEIGETLPHWEVAAYLINPAKLTESARTLKLTLGLLIAVLLFAIATGSWLIVTDLNRQLRLARQKTDFVSNVSHELKTPLTSIRMFSELLAEGRVSDSAKQRSYLNIITAETARLTRLINNVLDFSRMERGEKKYSFRDCDLVQLVRESVESYRPHLENNGFNLETDFLPGNLPVRGDCDALAQVIVNLLSNAEKYSGVRKEIQVRVARRDGPLPCAEVMIADRGLGVPPGSAEKIFEKFYRAHDSLSSGIQGSGLGLTLARQIARAHGGDIAYEPRDGGGSCFCLRLPLKFETSDEQR